MKNDEEIAGKLSTIKMKKLFLCSSSSSSVSSAKSLSFQSILVFLFLLQSAQLLQLNTVNSLEYSPHQQATVEERIYIVQKSLVREQQLQNAGGGQPPPDLPTPTTTTTIQQQQLHIKTTGSSPLLETKEQQHYHQRNQQQQNSYPNQENQQQQQFNIDHQQQQLQHHNLQVQQQPQQHHLHHHQQQQHQQHEPQNQQQQHNLNYEEQQQHQHNNYNNHRQHQSLANSMQQVLLDTVATVAGHHNPQQQHIHYTHFEWKHESTNQGELSEFYYNNIESTYPELISQDQLAYYHQYQQLQQQQQQQQQQPQYHHKQHIIYSANQQFEDDLDDFIDESFNIVGRSSSSGSESSCDGALHETSILLQNHNFHEQPTCKASSPNHQHHHHNNRGSPHHQTDSSGNVVPNFSHLTNKPSHNSNIESFPLAPAQYHYESSLISAIRHYWREVSGLCLLSAIFLNWLFVIIKRKLVPNALSRAEHAIESIQQQQAAVIVTRSSVSKDTNSSSAPDSACPMSLEDIDSSKSSSAENNNRENDLLNVTGNIRQRSSTLKLNSTTEPIPIPTKNTTSTIITPTTTTGHNSLSTSLSNSLNTTTLSEYNSRYSSDFDSIQRLGRGGFGIVFEARNKIDDCHYAVKRICLPLEKEARERVMREVRALAKLDHAGIVRYYNAWLETPPEEWLKQHDAQLGICNSKDGMNFPSTDGIYERNDYDFNITKGSGLNSGGNGGGNINIGGGRGSNCSNGIKLLGESGDNSSGGLFGSSQLRRRTNGFRRFLKNNSSSPSLDIVFEGSGSIRIESENKTEKTNSDYEDDDDNDDEQQKNNKKFGDNNYSDSEEDSDFIQFESKVETKKERRRRHLEEDGINGDEYSLASHLSDPFSSSSSSNSDGGESSSISDNSRKIDNNGSEEADEYSRKVNIAKRPSNNNNNNNNNGRDLRKNALNYQKELRQLNNVSLMENLHVEKVYLYIQMQLCRKDTLKDWLKTNCDNRDKTTIFDLFYQIVDAVEYVHSQDLIHRDLKPSNIFFSLDGTLKIGDFGLCRAKTSTGIGSSLDLQEYVAESDVERGFEAVHTEQVGTQLYMSPEQLNGLSYNQKVDIFAMGLILLELLVPFKTQMQRVNVLFKARNNLYSEDFKSDHSQEHELVKSLLNRSPLKRPTATEIKQHELLANAQLSQPVIERIYHRRRTISSNSSTE